MAKKGQLENIDLQKGKVKELKRQLNRHGVNFFIAHCNTMWYNIFI
jgi:aspartate/glutamate racemase